VCIVNHQESELAIVTVAPNTQAAWPETQTEESPGREPQSFAARDAGDGVLAQNEAQELRLAMIVLLGRGAFQFLNQPRNDGWSKTDQHTQRKGKNAPEFVHILQLPSTIRVVVVKEHLGARGTRSGSI
jgi:hypothetical protein